MEEFFQERAAAVTFDPAELSPTSTWSEIGDGGYSTVFSADWLGTTVAIKRTADKKPTAKLALLRELRLLRLAGPHPNLVQVLGVFEESNRLHCVLEYVPHTLRSTEIILAVDPVTVVLDVARALVHIHRLGIVHRDIKARNVLVTSASRSARARLIDFGLACSLQHDAQEWLHRSVGTKSYRPPEMKLRGRAAGSQDIYSLGAMVHKVCRRLPKTQSSQEEADYRLLSSLGARCLEKEPSARPDAMSLLVELQHHINRPVELDSNCQRVSISWEQEIELETQEQQIEDDRNKEDRPLHSSRPISQGEVEGADAEDAAMGKRSRPDSLDEERTTPREQRSVKAQ